MKQTILFLIVLFSVSEIIYSQTALSGEELLKAYRNAEAGNKNINELTDLSSIGVFVSKSEKPGAPIVSGKFEEIRTNKELYGFLAAYNSGFSQINIFDGKAYFFPGNGSDYFFMETDRPNFMKPNLLSNAKVLDQPEFLSNSNQFKMGVLINDSLKSEIQFNAQNFLIDQLSFEYTIKVLSRRCRFTYHFSDYKNTSGYMLPYKINKVVSTLGSVDYFIENYDLSRSYSIADFQNPQKSAFNLAQSSTGTSQQPGKITSAENEKAASDTYLKSITEANKIVSELISKKVNPFEFRDLNNQKFTDENLKGKITLIDLWATWCKPCVDEMPFLKTINNSFSKDVFQMWGISVDKSLETVTSFITKNKIPSWTVLHDPGFITKTIFKTDTYPTVILVDREGKIRDVYIGKGHEAEMVVRLGELVNEK